MQLYYLDPVFVCMYFLAIIYDWCDAGTLELVFKTWIGTINNFLLLLNHVLFYAHMWKPVI